MVQNDFFNNEEDLVLDLTKKQNNYFSSQGAELLAKSFFSYYKCEVFSAPESNLVDFLIKHKHNSKFCFLEDMVWNLKNVNNNKQKLRT